jgi:tetratricopeptide (TPR) repeat protein
MKKAKIIYLALLFVVSLSFSQNPLQEKLKLAQAYEKIGDYTNAEQIYLELYTSNKTNREYFEGIVRCKKALNKFTELIPVVEEQIAIAPNPELYALLGELNWRTGKLVNAKDCWQKAIQLEPNSEKTYTVVSSIQSSLQQFELAIETLLEGRKKLNSNTIFAEDLIRLYLITKNFKDVLSETLLMLNQTRNISDAQAKIGLLIAFKETHPLIQNALKNPPNGFEREYKLLLGWFFRATNQYDKALPVYIELDKSQNSRGYEVLNFAQSSLNDGEYTFAIKGFEYVVSLGKSSPYLMNALYGIAKAIEFKAIELNRADTNLIKDVLRRYEKIIDEYPNDPVVFEIKFRTAFLYAKYLFNHTTAKKYLKDLTNKNNPFSLNAYLLMGDIFLFEENFEEAEKMYRKVIQITINKKGVEYYTSVLKLAKSFYFQGSIDSAQYYFSTLLEDATPEITSEALSKSLFIEQNKQYTLALHYTAKAELKAEQNQLDSAITLYKIALEKTKGTPFAEFLDLQISITLLEMSDYTKSEANLKEFLKQYPESIYTDEALFTLGVVYYKQDKFIESIGTFTELLTKFPKSIFNAKARNYIEKIRNRQS